MELSSRGAGWDVRPEGRYSLMARFGWKMAAGAQIIFVARDERESTGPHLPPIPHPRQQRE